MDPNGRCHICQESTPIRYCPICDHWFCDQCRGKYWERGFAAVMELVKGRSGPDCCGVI